MPEDLLDRIVAQLKAAAPELPAARVDAIALQIRRDVGGSEVYIKKAPVAGKALRLGAALAVGVPLTQAFADLGVSTSYGYRLVRRLRKK